MRFYLGFRSWLHSLSRAHVVLRCLSFPTLGLHPPFLSGLQTLATPSCTLSSTRGGSDGR